MFLSEERTWIIQGSAAKHMLHPSIHTYTNYRWHPQHGKINDIEAGAALISKQWLIVGNSCISNDASRCELFPSRLVRQILINGEGCELPRRDRIEEMNSTHHIPVICPRTEFHETRLLVKGKVLDVDLTERFVNSRRLPDHLPGVV